MVLLCRHNSGMLGEDSAAEDIDMADAEQQVASRSIHLDSCCQSSSSYPSSCSTLAISMVGNCVLSKPGCVQRGGNKRKGKGKGGIPKAEANRELERQQAEMEDLTIR